MVSAAKIPVLTIAVVVIAVALGVYFIGFYQTCGRPISPPKAGTENFHIIERDGQLYFCSTLWEEISYFFREVEYRDEPASIKPGPVVIDGEIVCLPSLRGTEECAIGLRDSEGRYFGLSGIGQQVVVNSALKVGDAVDIQGWLSPSSSPGIYAIAGTIAVNSFVKIRARFSDKIVFERDPEVDAEIPARHCTARGWRFNSCGSSCASDAEFCTKECAITCESPTP